MTDYWTMTCPQSLRSATLKAFYSHSRHLLTLSRSSDYGVRKIAEECRRHRDRAAKVLRVRYGIDFRIA